MEWVHGGAFDDAPRALDREPPLDDLVGVERSELVNALGAPWLCQAPLREPCREEGERVFLFYTEDSPELGPVMVVEFDALDRVSGARWRQLEISAPEAETPPAGSQLAASSNDPDSEPPQLEIHP